MPDLLKLGIILNPEAGRGRGRYISKHLINYLHEKKISFELEKTNAPGHAKAIALRMKEKYEVILVVGGDGTLNEVSEGIIGSKTAVAILPIGSGNDFNKIVGFPKKIDHNIDAILNGNKKIIDIGQVDYLNSLGEKKKRYFINTLGIGLDAEIAYETGKIRFIRGLPLYFLGAIKALRKHLPNEYLIFKDKSNYILKAFLICIGNGCYEGGGFKLLPNAKINDGKLDICTVEYMPILKALRLVPFIIKGTHKGKKNIKMFNSKNIEIKSKKAFVLHGDGEILGENVVKAEIGLAKKRINIIMPEQQ